MVVIRALVTALFVLASQVARAQHFDPPDPYAPTEEDCQTLARAWDARVSLLGDAAIACEKNQLRAKDQACGDVDPKCWRRYQREVREMVSTKNGCGGTASLYWACDGAVEQKDCAHQKRQEAIERCRSRARATVAQEEVNRKSRDAIQATLDQILRERRSQTGTEANGGPGYGPNPQPPRLPTQGADPASGFGQGPSTASAADQKQLATIRAQQNVLRERIRIYEEGLADRDALARETLAGEGTFLGIPSRYLGLAKSVSAASDLALDAYAEADPSLGGEFLKGVTTIIKGGIQIANEERVSDRLITTVGSAGSVKVGDKNVHGMFGAGAAGAKLGLAVSQGRWADAVSEARNAGAIYAELAGNAKLSKGLGLVSSADEIMAGFRDYAESVDQMKKLEERGWEQSYQDKINKAFDRYLELERKRLQLESGVLENLRTGSSAPFGGLR